MVEQESASACSVSVEEAALDQYLRQEGTTTPTFVQSALAVIRGACGAHLPPPTGEAG